MICRYALCRLACSIRASVRRAPSRAGEARASELTDDDTQALVRRLIKQRREAAEQYRAAFSVKESAKRFHATLQLSGGFLELHPSAFFFGYQPFYYVEVVYAHIQFCKVGTKIVLFAGFRANR